MNLPDFVPLKVLQSSRGFTREALDAADHALLVVPKERAARRNVKAPRAVPLDDLLRRADKRGDDLATSRAANTRGTGITVATFSAKSTFAALSWARKALAECLRERPGVLAVHVVGLNADDARRAAASLTAAAHAAAFALPTFRTEKDRSPKLRTLRLHVDGAVDLAAEHAAALGNNVARWFTALPPNVLTAAAYRQAVETLAKERSLRCEFLDETALRKLKAGAFLAVAQGNPTRDAGILHVSYRPQRNAAPGAALVGKGILFDTGGTNLKPFKGMLDMHMDMQGSAVALGSLLALAELGVPYSVDAWLAVTQNVLAPGSYKSQDLVYAANGTSIQVIHTDAEGRMVLADTLALAARAKPQVIVDYATLTGACIHAVTERYSGVFSNRTAANQLLIDAGAASGERVWPFPMDEDFDEPLKSEIADVKQCAVETPGDHILAARFLSRFVPAEIPWIHVDLAAAQHKGGLAHVPTEVTGFGVRLTLELLRRQAETPEALAKQLSA